MSEEKPEFNVVAPKEVTGKLRAAIQQDYTITQLREQLARLTAELEGAKAAGAAHHAEMLKRAEEARDLKAALDAAYEVIAADLPMGGCGLQKESGFWECQTLTDAKAASKPLEEERELLAHMAAYLRPYAFASGAKFLLERFDALHSQRKSQATGG